MSSNIGLKQQLRAAKTTADLDYLILRGSTFNESSPKTQRQWLRIATARKNELEQNEARIHHLQETEQEAARARAKHQKDRDMAAKRGGRGVVTTARLAEMASV